MAKLSALQLCSEPDVDKNLQSIRELLDKCVLGDEDHLVVLPECCLFFGGEERQQLTLAQQTQQCDYLRSKLADIARQYQVFLVAGTVPLLSHNSEKFTNSCCVFSPQGQLLGQYDKIHLFDVEVNDNVQAYQESLYTQAGRKTKVIKTNVANIGLSVCYDLRFPELFRDLREQGADIITVPSAFTYQTGKAHWQALLQARAIENQCYIIAAGQQGRHKNGRETWGHSMIVSPWGEILACLPDETGMISVEYQPKELSRIRAQMPVQQHNQFTVELIHEKR